MMFNFTRTKSVTDPLDDNAKARIIGRAATEVSLHDDVDVTCPSLSELFYGSDADDANAESWPDGSDSDSDSDSSVTDPELIVAPILEDKTDPFKNLLAAHVLKAAQVFARAGGGKLIARRNVMAYLRNCGFDAAVCETRWEASGKLAAGSHEFIDVVRAPARYVVDLDFAAEFEIARPTEAYERLRRRLPAIFVGTGVGLSKILTAATGAALRSLRSGGLLLPPWRKYRFVQNKWLGPSRRTTTVFLAAAPSPAKRDFGVKCRAVGFDATVHGGGLLFPPPARTR